MDNLHIYMIEIIDFVQWSDFVKEARFTSLYGLAIDLLFLYLPEFSAGHK